MPDPYVPVSDDAVGGSPILLRPTTFDRHAQAAEIVEGSNNARYPRVGRGRTTDPSAGAWGYLASGSTIGGAGGLSLGGGTVQLCSRDTGTLTADGEFVAVLNPGDAITGPRILELNWTDGIWAVCLCGRPRECVFCRPCQGPAKDLLYSYSGSFPLSPTSGSGPLAFNGTDTWTSASFGESYVIELRCILNVLTARIIHSGTTLATFTTAGSTSCNPFALTWSIDPDSDAGMLGWAFLQISDPGPVTTPCPTPCDCTNCPACGGVILLHGGTITDDWGTHPLTVAAGISGLLTAPGFPTWIEPGPDFPHCRQGDPADVPYTLKIECYPTASAPGKVVITLETYSVRGRCQSPEIGIDVCGYQLGVHEFFTREVTPVCADGFLTATVDFSDTETSCATTGTVPAIVHSVTFSIPLGPTNAMCQSFVVSGCNGITIAAAGESTVSVYDSEGGTLLYSGTTVSGGIPEVYFENTGTPFWVTATSPDSRFSDYAGSRTLDCGGELSINLQPTDAYVCVSGCAFPLATSTVLHATHPKFGVLSMTYNPTGTLGAGWYATVTYSYPGCACCPASTVTVTCYLNRSLQFSDNWHSH